MTKPHGIQPSQMDRSVAPGVDFHRFCNGAWLDGTEIPDAYPRWGMFMQLRDDALFFLHDLMQRLAAQENEQGSNAQKIADLFTVGMDNETIEATGIAPLAPEFARIKGIRNRKQLMAVLARMHTIGGGGFFGFGAGVDYDNSDIRIASANQGGTSLLRDYYLKTDKDTLEKRAAYTVFVEQMFTLLGEKPYWAKRHAAEVIALETRLAEVSRDNKAMRDPLKNNNKMSRDEFYGLCPNLDLAQYLEQLGAPNFTRINVGQPEFFQALDGIITTTPMSVLRAYMRFRLVSNMASYLPESFGKASFDFFGTVMTGSKVQQERWKRIVGLVSGSLGEPVGELYVAEKFPPAAKARMLELNAALKEAMGEMFASMTWLSQETRDYAVEKLEAFVCHVGYPDKWDDYSPLTIDRSSLVENMIRVAQFGRADNLSRIDQPVNRNEWGMTPQTVNAQCSQVKNATFFPAAIFQHPFFDMLADNAFNLGAIGAVIGHEDWHNFDDKGSKFDKKGNVANWWTDPERESFDALMQLVKNLFESFVVIEDEDGKEAVHMQGDLVCGEAISDLMGLRIAYRALEKMIEKYGLTVDENGFNDYQRFFIAFGQLWASKARPAYMAWQATNDPHPIDRFRVLGTLANMPEFFKAFNLADDCPMSIAAHLRCDLIAGPKSA